MKQEKMLITGNQAGAWAARLAKVDYIPAYPITPQTQLIETIAEWIADGEMNTEFEIMDSEHSVMSAAVGGSAAGGRVFTATSSQGLMLMYEVLYIASGMRLPIVMANVSRALAAPIALWCDHDDFMSMRETGWIMFHAQNNQEVLDSILMGYKIAENKNVLLPIVVNMDGYILSYTSEPTYVPDQNTIDRFLGKYNPDHAFFKPGKPLVQGTAVLSGTNYTKFRMQHHRASLNALNVAQDVFKKYKAISGREYGFIEKYRLDDADIVLVTQGSISTTAKAAINQMREKGEKVGLLRLRMLRPWPKKHIEQALKNAQAIAVIDKNLSPGSGGLAYPDIREALYDIEEQPIVSNFITGLGGSPVTINMFKQCVQQMKKDLKAKRGRVYFV